MSRDKINTSGITPLGDRCVVEVIPEETVTEGGIIKPDSVIEAAEAAKADAILLESGSTVRPLVDIWPEDGARVLISKYAGVRHQPDIDGPQYRIVNWEDIVGWRKEDYDE